MYKRQVLGVYSNYVLLTQTIESFVTKIFSSITASIGNLVAEQSKEEVEKNFNRILFLNYWIIAFCSICLICLIQPFIHLWLGADYQLPMFTVLIIIVVFYFNGMRRTVLELDVYKRQECMSDKAKRIIRKYYEFLVTKFKILHEQKIFGYENVKVKYMLKEDDEADTLIIVFSACTRKGLKARYLSLIHIFYRNRKA